MPYASLYAKTFDRSNKNWSGPMNNTAFLKVQEHYANDLLRARGHVFLNEVYDMLGLPRSSSGQIVGWSLISNEESTVSFHVEETDDGSLWLDFNPDGVMYQDLPTV